MSMVAAEKEDEEEEERQRRERRAGRGDELVWVSLYYDNIKYEIMYEVGIS